MKRISVGYYPTRLEEIETMVRMQECSLSIRSTSEGGTCQQSDHLKIDNRIAAGVLLKDMLDDYSKQYLEVDMYEIANS